MKETSSLQSDFTKFLATADSSLLQTNIVLQQMEKSQKVVNTACSPEHLKIFHDIARKF